VELQPKSSLGSLILRFLDHTQLDTHTHISRRTPLNEGSARRRARYL